MRSDLFLKNSGTASHLDDAGISNASEDIRNPKNSFGAKKMSQAWQ
jgi:hypothetical protein